VPSLRGLREGDLLWVERPPGPDWRGLLAAAWAAGGAVLPVDHRLPAGWAKRLRAAARPTAALDDGVVRRLRDGVPAGDGVRLVMATSGTTARPKLVEHTADGLEAALRAGSARIGATAADPWVACLPVAHMGGMLVIARAALWDWPVEVHEGFDPGRVTAAVDRGVRFISLVPTMLGRLLAARVDLSRLETILVGGSSFDPALRRLAEGAGATVVHTYGLTESCGGAVYDGLALEGVEIRIGAGTGEILLRAPQVMRGYRLEQRATARTVDAEGWLRTGDAGRLTESRLAVDGRLDDAIVTGGEKVWPSQVEAALRADPTVTEVMVIGRPDDEWGERVEAMVVPADPAAPPTLEALRSHARDRLPAFALPRSIAIVRDLDRTSSGKARRTR
jgi:O-succinylbenzoic acid--CoA ligase